MNYPNPRPGDYTLHVTFRAGNDRGAIDHAHALMRALAAVPGVLVNLDQPPYVTDADDWAEAITVTCQWQALNLSPGCDGSLGRDGCGRRLCQVHREEHVLVNA